MALSSDAEQILVLAQHLPPDDKLELAERLIADVRQHDPRMEDKNEQTETERTPLPDVTDPDFDFANLPMVGIWSDREDMTDPVEWVRTTRRREWGGRE
jgi:hypothetical protein